MVVFRNWLHNTGKTKLYSLLTNKNIITFDISGSANLGVSGSVVSMSRTITNTDTTIQQIENIIKLFNKHKALLEASKGIE